LKEIKGTIIKARKQTFSVVDALNDNGTATMIIKACDSNDNLSSANGTLSAIGLDLSNIEGSLTSFLDLMDCSRISPIFRQLLYGSTCTDSIGGLAWLYSMLILITILGFVILSTRAALYNPVIRGRRNKRREKEFQNYKEYMAEFYDTSKWEIDCIPEIHNNDNSDTDETECYRIDGSNSQATYSDDNEDENHVGTDSIDRSLSLTPAVSNTEKSSAMVACSQLVESDANTAIEIHVDDDDDSYDSTYSVDAGEERSVSSSSVFSIFMKRRIQTLHQFERNKIDGVGSQDEIVSSMSSGSSILKRFMVRHSRIGKLPLQDSDPLSIHPRSTTPHHPYDHRINSHDDDDSSVENDENDSNVGVLLTPQALRHPLQHLNKSLSSSQRKRNLVLESTSSDDLDEISTSPLALELQPLSPSVFISPNAVQKANPFRDDDDNKYPLKGSNKHFRWPVFR
jgi:hypothetical protein